MVRCSRCGKEHDIFEIEPRFARPDAYLAVPSDERAARTRCGDDWCRIQGADGEGDRFFLRVVMPFEVRGESRHVSWGIWVEVSEAVYRRVQDLWDDPHQASEPLLPGSVANQLESYPPTLGLSGGIQLVGPARAPRFVLAPEQEHPLVVEQRTGVYPERALEWVSRFLH